MVRGLLVCLALMAAVSGQFCGHSTKFGDNKHDEDAHDKVMFSSAGRLITGYFVGDLEMDRDIREGILVLDSIQFGESGQFIHSFSTEFTDKSSSDKFLSTVEKQGSTVAVKANAHYLLSSVSGSKSKTHKTVNIHKDKSNKTSDFFSSIKLNYTPVKSVNLDPCYMRLNGEVLSILKQIESSRIPWEHKMQRFIKFFGNYGSHFMNGPMQFGGTLIIRAESYMKGSSDSKSIQKSVRDATDEYLKVSLSFGDVGGGGEASKTHHYSNSSLSTFEKHNTQNNITFNVKKHGGPSAPNNIRIWREGLMENKTSWALIDMSTGLIAVWELLTIHHKTEFHDAEELARQMEKAWTYITGEQAVLTLSEEFRSSGISSSTAYQRKQLIVDMLARGKLVAQADSRYAHIDITRTGQVAMSALQEETLDNDTTILPYLNIMLLSTIPHVVYLKLESKNDYLGHIIIELTGYTEYPRLVQQFLELSTGKNKVRGTYRGAGFNQGVGNHGPGQNIMCSGYMGANGQLQSAPLFPVEAGNDKDAPYAPMLAGQVRGWEDQSSGFFINTQSYPAWRATWPVFGNVKSGLGILQAVAAQGEDFVKDLKFTDCGLVVFD